MSTEFSISLSMELQNDVEFGSKSVTPIYITLEPL